MKYQEGRDWSLATRAENRFSRIIGRLGLSFIKCQRDYARYFTVDERVDDAGYFYNERTNIGFLAAAAWRMRGWVALEEFRYDKKSKVDGKKFSKGRADLFICAPKKSGGFSSVAIEAKQVYVGGVRRLESQLSLDNPTSALNDAIRDATYSVELTDADYRCAAVFTVLSIPIGERFEKLNVELSEAFYPICKRIPQDWVGFAFFPKQRGYPKTAMDGTERGYPAVGVTIVRLP